MNIAHVTYGLGIGGIETMLVNIANEQASFGHNVHIIVINDIADQSLVGQISPEVKIKFLSRPVKSRDPRYLLRLNTYLHSISPDVIHLHYASISRFILLPGLRRKLCVTLHALCRPSNIIWLDRSGPVFAISDMVREDISNKLGLESETVCNGINLSSVKYRNVTRRKSDPFRIVQVSRLNHAEKGQDILIRAVANLIESGHNIKLTFIGDGESRQYLKDLVAELGIEDIVEFLGSRSQHYVLTHLSEYDLFVQPSRFDGFGLTVAEAMASGIPVLVSDNNAPMEVIGYGEYGFHFRGEDASDCAEKIKSIMNSYPDANFLAAAAERVKSQYNVRRTAERYIELYEKKVIAPNR